MKDFETVTLEPVKSSNIAEIGYDKENSLLVIVFTNGSRYGYRNVPQVVHDQLMNAPSIGAYWAKEKQNYKDYVRF